MADARPGVLVVAGLDPSGGAGLLADVRMCERLGCRPVGVATALTEQDTVGLRAVNPVAPTVVAAQLATLVADVEVAAVKLGMLGSPALAATVAAALADVAAPVVWDPVGRATRGAAVFSDDELAAVATTLGPRLALITPNADEAAALTGRAVASVDDAVAAGRAIVSRYRVGAALVKGGHWGQAEAIDVLVADEVTVLRGPRTPLAVPVHGTGCALATAIACNLARGTSLQAACSAAKATVATLIAGPARPGRGRPAVL